MHGMHCIKSYSKTQSNIALSSGEAELYAAVFGVVEMNGAQRIIQYWGGDSVHALGGCLRGLGLREA